MLPLFTVALPPAEVISLCPRVQALLDGQRRLVLDPSGVDFCDSVGLNELPVPNRRAAERGGALALADVPVLVRRILSLTGTDAVLAVHATVDAGVAGWQQAGGGDSTDPSG